MGTWSTERFGNDDALDWFGELRESTSPLSFIQETLNTGSTESVVAASAVLAVMESYGGIEVHADVGGNLSANESQVLHTAMLGGLGIGLQPIYAVAGALARGELQVVLADWRPASLGSTASTRPADKAVVPSANRLEQLASRC